MSSETVCMAKSMFLCTNGTLNGKWYLQFWSNNPSRLEGKNGRLWRNWLMGLNTYHNTLQGGKSLSLWLDSQLILEYSFQGEDGGRRMLLKTNGCHPTCVNEDLDKMSFIDFTVRETIVNNCAISSTRDEIIPQKQLLQQTTSVFFSGAIRPELVNKPSWWIYHFQKVTLLFHLSNLVVSPCGSVLDKLTRLYQNLDKKQN